MSLKRFKQPYTNLTKIACFLCFASILQMNHFKDGHLLAIGTNPVYNSVVIKITDIIEHERFTVVFEMLNKLKSFSIIIKPLLSDLK